MTLFLEEIIEEFHREGLPRFSVRELGLPTHLDKAVTVIGLRRVGKTYLLYQTISALLDAGVDMGSVFYINFEDERLADFTEEDFTRIVELFYKKNPDSNMGYLFLDEIQNVHGWERFVRRLLERKRFRVFLTGSSSKLLGKEIATSLRGRSLSYHLFPLSFREFLDMKGFTLEKTLIERDRGRLKMHLDEYMAYGGFPETVDYERALKIRTLKEYLDMVVYKDLVERYGIEKVSAMRFLIRSLSMNFAKETSVRKLHNFLASSQHSLSKTKTYEYFSYLEDIGFVHPLRKFGQGLREIEGSVPKIYLVDVGFASLFGVEDLGRRMENLVAIELLRCKHYRDPVREVHYWRTPRGEEVDFVVVKGREVVDLIQVTYASGRDEIDGREVRSLLKASKELGCRRLTVVTWDYEAREDRDGDTVSFVPLWKWLLEAGL
ncbi:MAG: ATP-binding protein [Methanobacteriota archaeon]|nr:MAG: ATP-binding protein [Euryarchaeota archaeon]